MSNADPKNDLPCHRCKFLYSHSNQCPGIGHCPTVLVWLDGADVTPPFQEGQHEEQHN
jgi:hypothetical protein